MSATIITCASQAYLGDLVDVGVAVRRAAPRMPVVMTAALLRYAGLIIGAFLFLVGALWVAARLFALTPLIIIEDASIPTAFRRSGDLSLGRKQHILNTLGLATIIYWVVALGVSVMARLTGSYVVQVLAGAIYTILAYPIIAITECLLYYDARIQSEGLDIELMAVELGAAPIQSSAL
jgi:membrane-anchored glycerophosphoryl diester phosphodiesterase (GDPDase)